MKILFVTIALFGMLTFSGTGVAERPSVETVAVGNVPIGDGRDETDNNGIEKIQEGIKKIQKKQRSERWIRRKTDKIATQERQGIQGSLGELSNQLKVSQAEAKTVEGNNSARIGELSLKIEKLKIYIQINNSKLQKSRNEMVSGLKELRQWVKWFGVGVGCLLCFVGIIGMGLFVARIRSKRRRRAKKIAEKKKTRDPERHLEILLGLQKVLRCVKPPPVPQPKHDMMLTWCNELHRVKTRLGQFSDDTNNKLTRPLGKSLERQENGLNEVGYEIIDQKGKQFEPGMVAKARFISSEGVPLGERLITRVIKPLVNFKGKMVQPSEIEVSIGVERVPVGNQENLLSEGV